MAPAHGEDGLDRLVGDAVLVRDAFEQLPMMVTALAGPDHRVVAANAAHRRFTGRSEVIGVRGSEAFPGVDPQQLLGMLDRVYTTGEPETGTEWRLPDPDREAYADFRVLPRPAADGTSIGLLIIAADVTGRVVERQAARQQAEAAQRRYQGAREMVTQWQQALLPTTLPVLPRARIAARYLVAGPEQAAGGDWFDAVPLADGRIALAVGDVVGRGAAASAAIARLRAVLCELLTEEDDLARILERTDALAARTPALRAATLVLAVLDPAGGTLRYTTCGHPAPLVIGAGGAARFLEGTGTGPLGTGSAPLLAATALAPGEVVLLYSDGLIERPDRTIPEGMAELAAIAADAMTADAMTADAMTADASAGWGADRVCQRTVDLLARTGYADDVTTLAAQRLAAAVPALRLELPGVRASLTVAREAFTGWLARLDATAEDIDALHLALVEIVTNAIEHAYPKDEPGIVAIEARLSDDGRVECKVTDHGTWRQPDQADADRGHGLMVAGQVIDAMLVSHPAPPPGVARPAGTVVALRHRLRRPAVAASGRGATAGGQGESPFTADTSIQADGTARAQVRGRVDITTADLLARRLLSACRGGTVRLVADLTGVTQLASAGVRALYLVRERLAAHRQDLTLITAPGSSAQAVLDLVQLSHLTGPGPALGGAAP